MTAPEPPPAPTRDRFGDAYDDTPPWDIGRPQPDVIAAFDELEVVGSSLDLGCGTGEHVLALAKRGLEAFGLDSTPAAIGLARAKARERGVERARFIEGDALALDQLGRRFDLIVDCGLFHVISDAERERYVEQVRLALAPGGIHLMLGFSTNTTEFGPRGYSEVELRGYFARGFVERFVRPAAYEINDRPHPRTGEAAPRLDDGRAGMRAWLSAFERKG